MMKEVNKGTGKSKRENFSGLLNHSFDIYLILALFMFNLNLYSKEKPESKTSFNQSINHTPIKMFGQGDKLKIEVSVKEQVEWLRFFYRVEGVEHFQVRKMEKSKDDFYIYIFDTSLLVTAKFNYYLMAKLKEKVLYLPQQAPEKYFEVKGEISEPKKKKSKFPVSIKVNGSLTGRITGESELEEQKNFLADGNINISKLTNKDDLQINLSLNSTSTNHPLEGNDNFDLSNLTLSIKMKNHFMKLGDISFISSSQFSIYGLGRRGVEYQFDNKKFLFHVFDISSQQQLGWEGLIPKANLSLMGGVLGYSFFDQKFTLKLIYVTGKDDPSEASNVGSSFLESREGNVWALVPELNLFNNKLKITGEFAQSNHDKNLQDEEGPEKDQAWRIGGIFTSKIITLRANYKLIGKNFNPIGFQYFINDREGYDITLGINLKKIHFNLSYLDEQNNVENDPSNWASNNKNGGANLTWSLFKWISLNLGYRKNIMETFGGENQRTLFGDYSSDDYSLGLNFVLGTSKHLNLSVSRSDLKSETTSDYDRNAWSINLGGSLKFGKNFSFCPSLSYSISKNDMSGTETETYNVFLSAEVAIIPRVLSISTSSSYFKMMAESGDLDNINVSLCLNVYLGWIKKQLANAVISLKGYLKQIESENYSYKYESLWLQFSFNF